MSINQLWWNSRKPSDATKSNFEIFLDSVSPMVSINPDSKIKVGALKSLEEEHEREGVRGDCFLLSELWKAYATWSGFGAESPFILENGNTVIQFYHPTLSALQIYTTQPYASLSDSEGSTAGSSDQEMEERFEATEDDALTAQLENGQQTRDHLGHLYLHYNEESDPDKRPPFFVKINELADTYPALMTLKSTDLCPDSWVAVAWYVFVY
ncbi:uncharacterized protein LOC117923859 [Vitis riparia]|uniref:uncharacterized protein LOC117923859 n=1 Tax=Vitis riparia TaxID=96939 RepID=UPI00155A6C4D|nr:uncharacterized protein LOC117923859 [Vitis riparia]